MGNRFSQLGGYHNLILAHGILAAITFLAIVPASVLLSRFSPRPREGRLSHVSLNVLTVILVIVIFTLGNVAVGPSRRLSNPHHGTGTALFVLVLFSFFQGWWAHRKDWRRKHSYEPLKVTVSGKYTLGRANYTDHSLASHMARMDCCTPRSGPDTAGSDAIRIAQVAVHSLHLGSFHTFCNFLFLG